MAETNVSGKQKEYAERAYQLPVKIERRLTELVQMGEFDQGDVEHCRRTYWSARDDWHQILVNCYLFAKERQPLPTGTNATEAN